jgi:hypothetical protein
VKPWHGVLIDVPLLVAIVVLGVTHTISEGELMALVIPFVSIRAAATRRTWQEQQLDEATTRRRARALGDSDPPPPGLGAAPTPRASGAEIAGGGNPRDTMSSESVPARAWATARALAEGSALVGVLLAIAWLLTGGQLGHRSEA